MLFDLPEFTIQPTGLPPTPDDTVLCLQNEQMLLTQAMDLPKVSDILPLLPENAVLFELMRSKECGYYTLPPYSDIAVAETTDLHYVTVRFCRSMPYEKAMLVMSGCHLWNWYRNNRFCGRCGHESRPDKNERALRCPKCNFLHFPMIAPAIIVAITCGDQILLARNARSPYPHFALIAGYVEVGETLEHALRREVMEEVGIKLNEVRYLKDQPWGLSGSHMFAFHTTADSNQPLRIQESELTEARWFDRSELEPRDTNISVASQLIESFRLGTL